MENKSGNGWKFFALLFGALLAGAVGYYVYKQQNPEYDPWEEPWENSSSPVDLGFDDDSTDDAVDEVEGNEKTDESDAAEADADKPAEK